MGSHRHLLIPPFDRSIAWPKNKKKISVAVHKFSLIDTLLHIAAKETGSAVSFLRQ
jgi:hypothetical protein